MLSETDDQIFGSLKFFDYTVETAIDEFHCGTNGYRFAINHDSKEESFRTVAGIK